MFKNCKTSFPPKKLYILLCLLFLFSGASGQYPANYTHTILPLSITDQILESISGELAMQHVNALAPYSRPRIPSEFPASFNEIGYVVSKLREYGLAGIRVDTVGKTLAWRGIEGSVWEVSPGLSKIADLNDVPEMLPEGTRSGEVRAKLIWAGEGEQSFFDINKQDVKGKIVVTSGYIYMVHSRAMAAGAIGTISFFSGHPLTDPLQIPNMGIGGLGYAFLIPPREGVLLRDRLLRREDIEVQVKIKSAFEKADLLVPQCIVQGTDTSAGEIILTAHLFEGFVKMGANDNMSGSAVILEVARTLNDLINAGKIPRPVRNIRFLWVPEFSGTIPWVNSHLARVKKALCDINLDMVGLRLRENKSFFCLNRSGYSTANFANDVMECFFRYVGESNVEGITDDLGRRGFSRRIVSPTGSDDPFYYRIMTLHGSSDNAVFNDWGVGVPGLKMITWPDNYYHSSEDNPDKCDPTQLRRAAFIAAAGAYTMASAGSETSVAILGEMYSGALVREGIQAAKSSDMILKSGAPGLEMKYKRACWNLEGLTMGEKSAIEKIRQISSDPEVIKLMNSIRKSLDNLLKEQLLTLHGLMKERCLETAIPEISLKLNDKEKLASRTIPVKTPAALSMGFGGAEKQIMKVPKETRDKYPFRKLVNQNEAAGLADGNRSILQIKKIVDAEFERETPLEDLLNYFEILKLAGLMEYK